MARVSVSIVHDELGRVISVARPSPDAKVIVLGGQGHSVLETEVDEEDIAELATGVQQVDVARRSVMRSPGSSASGQPTG